MKKSPEGLDALNAITDKVLAYRPNKKQNATNKRSKVVIATGISVARVKEAKERRGKLPKDEYFSPLQRLTPLR